VKVGGLGAKPLAGPRHARQREAFELICPKCGNELPEKAKFCHECGHSVSGESGAEAPDVSLGGLATLAEGTGTSVPSPVDASLGGLKTMTGAGTSKGGGADSGVPLSDRYEVKEEIGRGGFAVVHLGRDLRLDRPVAIKRLLPEAAAGPHGTRTVERFEREAQAIASLNHRNVLAVYDTDRDAEGRYIVMEYVEGGTLRDHLKATGPLPVPEAVELAVGICRGLASAHRKGVVHRDVKPANILLSHDEGKLVPKLTDFGLARAGGGSDVSMTGFGMGTPFYMAPEQRRDAKGVNHTADIFSVGKTLYELVTGQVPENVDPGEIPPPPELAEIIFRCIKTKSEERYFSVEDLARDLENLPDPQRSATRETPTGVNPCPSCGRENTGTALFCVACGEGLTRDCPECGVATSVNVSFCASCGTDIDAFSALSEALPRMADHTQKRRWSRVAKELGALPSEPRLPGDKGRKLLEDVQTVGRKAEGTLSRLKGLVKRIEAAIEVQNFDETLKVLDMHDELASEEEAKTALREQVQDARHLAGLRRLRDQVREFAAAREHEKALRAEEMAVELFDQVAVPEKPNPLLKAADGSPSTDTAASLKQDIGAELEVIEKRRKEADKLLATAVQAGGEGRFDASRIALAEADGVYPGRADCTDALARVTEAIEQEQSDVRSLRDCVEALGKALETRELVAAKQAVEIAEAIAAERSVHPDQTVHEEWERLRSQLTELCADLAAREREVAELNASARKRIGEGQFEGALEVLAKAEEVFADCPESLGLVRDTQAEIDREHGDLDRLKAHVENASEALGLQKLDKVRQTLDRAAELVASWTIDEGESVHAEWLKCRERLAEMESRLAKRQAKADELVASCREKLEAGALSEAAALVGEIDSVESRRASREGLHQAILDTRRARSRRRSLWAVASLTVLAVLAVLARREVRYRVARGSFERAVVEGRLDEARALAAAKPLFGRLGDAQRLLAVFADTRNAREEALRAEASADAPSLWQNAESLLESPAAHGSEGSSRDYASHRDALLSGWRRASDGYAKAKARAEGVQSLRKARAEYEALWNDRPWQAEVLSAEARTPDRAKLTALLDRHGGAEWLATKQALDAASVLERGEDWKKAVAKVAKATASLPDAVKAADRPFRETSYDKALAAGQAGLAKEEWRESERQFGIALAVPGYADDQAASTGRKSARVGAALGAARGAKTAGNWEAVVGAADKVLALDGGNEGALALKREAKDHLPSLRVVCVLDGREVPGAAITVNGSLQEPTTPATLNLEKGKTYAFQVTLPARGATRYTAFAKSLATDWKGERELRAVVKEETDPTAGNLLGMEFVEVPAGSFRMGSADGDSDEKPMHEVRITRPFWLGKCEVMQAEYGKLMGRNPSHFKGARNPVESVSYDDALAFCKRMTERERAAGRLLDGYAYRLPTEAEWEYAARGGMKSKGFTYSGSNNAGEVAWHSGNSGDKSHPVDGKKPNELGLHDMSGNVWEWCHDWYGKYPSEAVTDPTGARTGLYRVRRGGSWSFIASYCRSASRFRCAPSYSFSSLGFRVALAAPVR
jgi:formylglycine-generating enzyme